MPDQVPALETRHEATAPRPALQSGEVAREARCQCGQLTVTVSGDPFAVSLCHCLACQRRTGSAFATQAAFNAEQVEVSGRYSDYSRISEESDAREHVFHFCPECGSQVFQHELADPDLVIVSVGAFADPDFPAPTISEYEDTRHGWVELPDTIHREIPGLWAEAGALYEAGDYAGAAAKGREVLAAHPGQGQVTYNTACCESLAGEADNAIEHLRQAIGIWDGCRELAKGDTDFDPIRSHPAFTELTR